MQRNFSDPADVDRRPRHRRRRRARAGLLSRARTARLAVAVVAVAILGGGAGYLVTHATPAPQRHAADRSRSTTASPAPSPSTASPPPTGQAGDFQVAAQWFTFTEPATAELAARTLPVEVRFPVISASPATTSAQGVGEFPLVVFAPGYRQCGAVYSDLLTQWASAGYVVAVVNFPLTNCNTPSPEESDLIHQPQDVATVIERLEEMSEQKQGPLAGLINSSRVAVAGHSDGGDTVAAMAAMSCCRYPGLRAAIVLAGAEWPAFTGQWFGSPTPPMLFVQGTADAWNPPATSMQLYQADTTGVRYYLDLFGANHFTPYEGTGPPEPIVEQVTIDFLDQYVAGAGDETSTMQSAGNVPSVAQLVTGGHLP